MRYTYVYKDEKRVVEHGMDEKPEVRTKDGKLMVKEIFASPLVGMDKYGSSN